MKKIFTLIMVLVMVAVIAPMSVFADQTYTLVSVHIDDQELTSRHESNGNTITAFVTPDGQTMMSVRGFLEAIGYNVTWDNAVYANYTGIEILSNSRPKQNPYLNKNFNIKDDIKVFVDGKEFTGKKESNGNRVRSFLTSKGQVFVSIRGLLELGNYSIEWNQDKYEVRAYSSDFKDNNKKVDNIVNNKVKIVIDELVVEPKKEPKYQNILFYKGVPKDIELGFMDGVDIPFIKIKDINNYLSTKIIVDNEANVIADKKGYDNWDSWTYYKSGQYYDVQNNDIGLIDDEYAVRLDVLSWFSDLSLTKKGSNYYLD